MDFFQFPKEITTCARIDAFIEAKCTIAEAGRQRRFFSHRREWARTDFEHGGLPRKDWEALLREMRVRADKAGFLRLALPEEYGGKNIGNLAMAIIHLMTSGGEGAWPAQRGCRTRCRSSATFPAGADDARFGTDEQKKTLLPGMLNGTVRLARSVSTENPKARLERDVDGDARGEGRQWRINGEKMWNTGVRVASHDAS